MGLEEAHAVLYHRMLVLEDEYYNNPSREKYQVYEAVKFAVEKLGEEISSYCNLP